MDTNCTKGIMEVFNVIENQTGLIVGTYRNVKRARQTVDRLNLEYGAIRYRVERAVVE